ncbi:SagB family peptide dehydrogenase [Nonomuraea sp. NPDC059023]|uniref:SagB family peptide dehydrogenase n=1 Tax=unclassified Nonomuraea TaxID=2593643 RepID=UPI0036BFC17D
MWFALWSFREDVYLDFQEKGLALSGRWGDRWLPMPAPPVVEALRRMCLGPISLENVITRAADAKALNRILVQLHPMVIRSYGPDKGQALLSVVPMSAQARFRPAPLRLEAPVRLSRFVSIASDGRDWRMESPLCLHRVVLHHAQAMSLVGGLSRPALPSKLTPISMRFVQCLLDIGMVVQASGTGDFEEDADPVHRAWTPLNLMFHSRTTQGRHDHDFGQTHRLSHRVIEPVVKPPVGDNHVDLPRPGWQKLIATDPPLIAALEAANTKPACGGRAPTIDDLGELLYRTVRVRSLTGDEDGTSTLATSDRPYRSAGGTYGLEVYVTVSACAGVQKGVYHYDPLAHRLTLVTIRGDKLLENSRQSANLAADPPVLVTLTARFRRQSWKFNGLSYALLLKDVGALTQTFLLVSAAIGLSAGVLDSSDVDVTAGILGLDWLSESGVGGLVIGETSDDRPDDTQETYPVNDREWSAYGKSLMC